MKHAQIFTITVETFGHTTIETVPFLSDANAKIKCEELFKPFLVCGSGINSFLDHANIKPTIDKCCADVSGVGGLQIEVEDFLDQCCSQA